MTIIEIIRSSWLYRVGKILRRWGRHSTVVAIVTNKNVQLGVVAVVLLVSMVSVFRSNANAAVKFLSFALLFVLTALVTWSVAKPRAE